jgi:protein SCO1/2
VVPPLLLVGAAPASAGCDRGAEGGESNDEQSARSVPTSADRFAAGGFPVGRIDPARTTSALPMLVEARSIRGNCGGGPYILTFLFTDCRDVCPLIGQEIAEALRRVSSRQNQVAALAVRRATPRTRSGPSSPANASNFRYLIGARAQLAAAWRANFAVPQPPGIRESKHNRQKQASGRSSPTASRLDRAI